MKLFYILNGKTLNKCLKIINEFSSKFPFVTYKDIDWNELSKHYQLEPKALHSTLIFLDCLRLNNSKIEINLINKIKVKSEVNSIKFEIYPNKKAKDQDKIILFLPNNE